MARRDEAVAGRTLLASFCIEVEEVEISTDDETGGGGNGLKAIEQEFTDCSLKRMFDAKKIKIYFDRVEMKLLIEQSESK